MNFILVTYLLLIIHISYLLLPVELFLLIMKLVINDV